MPILIRFCRSGNIRKVLFFANFTKIVIMSVILIIEIEHLRILDFVKSPQIRDNVNTRKLPDLQYIYMVNLPSAEYIRLPNMYTSAKYIHVAVCVCRIHKAQ